ncbi:hypothetical protein SASPL_120940 [Salvia splendens]|uniref:Uncharacterized protein n=1 Tax=Salvia splendens TaxID=180675 RepID=A0A8X8ZW42_SALSN|nr:hypothetical protein SASPL_120940 [Salvia splendens]
MHNLHQTCSSQIKMISVLQSHSPTILNLSSSFYVYPPQIPAISSSKLSWLFKNSHKSRSQTTIRRSEFGDGVDPVQEPSFFDENGVVQDMDGYLNYLSLEYESVWDTKPSWSDDEEPLVPAMDNSADRNWNSYSQLANFELDRGYFNRSNPDLFVVVHISLLLSKGIFGYDHRATEQGNKWPGRYVWDENRTTKLKAEQTFFCREENL